MRCNCFAGGKRDAGEDPVGADSQDLKNVLIIGHDGIRYDAKGQNTLAATLLAQLQGKSYVPVWPDKAAVQPPALPFKGWG